MTIADNLETFNGKPISDFDPEVGIHQPEAFAYRLRIDYDDYEKGKRVTHLLEAFYQDAQAARVEEIVIGTFGYDDSPEPIAEIVESLVSAAPRLPRLKMLFIGDITYEEYEISWIQQGDVSPVLEAYPQLEYFRVRGGNGLSLGKLHHEQLKTLIVETGGLSTNVIEQVTAAHLPNLEHLELWLGTDNYGFDASILDLEPLLQSNHFPKLRYLGLKDSEIADELAIALQNAPLLAQLETLDLSLGTLGDKGAKALLANPEIKKLQFLDLHHHFISEELVAQLQQLGIRVDLGEQMEEEEDGYRYVAVSE